jgi:hypothetical protein
MTTFLTTNTYTTVPIIQTNNTAGPTITLPEPISYEFQVAEWIDDNEKIIKVALQVKKNVHDQYGNIKIHGYWQEVPRIKLKL